MISNTSQNTAYYNNSNAVTCSSCGSLVMTSANQATNNFVYCETCARKHGLTPTLELKNPNALIHRQYDVPTYYP